MRTMQPPPFDIRPGGKFRGGELFPQSGWNRIAGDGGVVELSGCAAASNEGSTTGKIFVSKFVERTSRHNDDSPNDGYTLELNPQMRHPLHHE